MNLATAAIATVLLACCIVPVMILDRKGKKNYKENEEKNKHKAETKPETKGE